MPIFSVSPPVMHMILATSSPNGQQSKADLSSSPKTKTSGPNMMSPVTTKSTGNIGFHEHESLSDNRSTKFLQTKLSNGSGVKLFHAALYSGTYD